MSSTCVGAFAVRSTPRRRPSDSTRELQHEICEGRHIQPSSESMVAFCTRYLDDHEAGIAGTTYTRSEGIMRNHVKKDLGRVPLSRFTPKVAASWKTKRLESGLSPSPCASR